MADEVFRQVNPSAPQITGRIPPKFKEVLAKSRGEGSQQSTQQPRRVGSESLEEIISALNNKIYDELELPSRGFFYKNGFGPEDGILHMRAMTGEEEQILTTERLVRNGQAINMIFGRCLKEKQFKPENFLVIDRTYLLIWLRGISYGTMYEVELKCPSCDKKFPFAINLDSLLVRKCPDDFKPPLEGKLPESGLPFSYKLPSGADEDSVQEFKKQHEQNFQGGLDQTLSWRTATLLNNIGKVTSKEELHVLLKHLPIGDVNYLRNLVNDPPFGVDSKVQITCSECFHDFEIDLPYEINFFFPRPKKERA